MIVITIIAQLGGFPDITDFQALLLHQQGGCFQILNN